MTNLFRDEATDAKRRRVYGEVRISQPPSSLAWAASATVVVAISASCLFFISFTRKETVQGYLSPTSGLVQVTGDRGGKITRIFVDEGMHVARGAALLELSSDVGSVSSNSNALAQLQEIAGRERALIKRREATAANFSAQGLRLRRRVEASDGGRSLLERRRLLQIRAVEIAKGDLDRIEKLQISGYAPRQEVVRLQRALLAEESSLATIEEQIASAEASVVDTRTELSGLPSAEMDALAAIDAELSTVAQQRANAELAQGYVLRAPISGTVSGLEARVGQSFTPQSALVTLTKTTAVLEANLLVPTRASGFLRQGQEVRIQVDAYPYQRFGFVKGKISSISRAVLVPGEALTPVEYKVPVYRVRVSIDDPWIMAYGVRHDLRAGMTVLADVTTDRRRLWQQLFDPVLAAAKRLS